MRTLSNNRYNAIGPWCVYSYYGPSYANGYIWGGRTPTQGGRRDGKYSQIFRAVGITAKEAEGGVLTINPEQERNTP